MSERLFTVMVNENGSVQEPSLSTFASANNLAAFGNDIDGTLNTLSVSRINGAMGPLNYTSEYIQFTPSSSEDTLGSIAFFVDNLASVYQAVLLDAYTFDVNVYEKISLATTLGGGYDKIELFSCNIILNSTCGSGGGNSNINIIADSTYFPDYNATINLSAVNPQGYNSNIKLYSENSAGYSKVDLNGNALTLESNNTITLNALGPTIEISPWEIHIGNMTISPYGKIECDEYWLYSPYAQFGTDHIITLQGGCIKVPVFNSDGSESGEYANIKVIKDSNGKLTLSLSQ